MKSLLLLIFLSMFSSPLFAKSQWKDNVPNNTSYFGQCGVCHHSGSDYNTDSKDQKWTDFSKTSDKYGHDWTREIDGKKMFEVDSDGDGYTNGEELGDPLGTWNGDFPVDFKQTSPSDPNDTPCGNGTLEGPEECDKTELNGKSCSDAGADGEGLKCSDKCKFDTSECKVAEVCGDAKISGDEECDGTQLNGKTCTTQGAKGEGLSCSATCKFDTSTCKIKTGTNNATNNTSKTTNMTSTQSTNQETKNPNTNQNKAQNEGITINGQGTICSVSANNKPNLFGLVALFMFAFLSKKKRNSSAL